MSNNIEMSQETAKVLFEEGAILVFLDVPEETEFGIDMKSWTTAPNFKGVKMIPPGIHYIHYSSVGNMGDVAPRVGFIHNFSKQELVVMKWDTILEDINPKFCDNVEVDRIRSNLRNLDHCLGPYPYNILSKWTSLTSHLTVELVKKLQPVSGQIRSALELVACKNADRPRGKSVSDKEPSTSKEISSPLTRKRKSKPGIESIDDDLLPDLKPIAGTELRLTPFPENNYPEGSTPAEITKHSLDSSYVLEYLIKNHKRPIDLIGELQFSFICFLVGHSLEAFEHWKRLVNIICSCEEAITKYRIVYDTFITVFEAQLVEVPEEFLADIVSNNNFVYGKLRELFRSIESSDIDGRLKSKANRFKDQLSKKYLWDFHNLNVEEDDEAPVIVEL